MVVRTGRQAAPPAGPPPADPRQAWQPYTPGAGRPWNLALAGHLFRRAAFGAPWQQLQQAVAAGPQRAVDGLIRPPAAAAAFDRTFDEHEAAAADAEDALRAWWLRRMIETPHPLLEKMTLFWHGLLAADGAAVKSARLLHQHVRLLRAQALGDFRVLLESLLSDAAMLAGHGAEKNHRSRPNERFARHLLERVTLGPGRASADDVRAAAAAFTGSFVLDGRYRYIAREHDTSRKTLLGQEGDFSGEDVVRILLDQPACAETLARELYRWLIAETEEPAASLIAPLAESFASDHDVGRLVETMLRSNQFFSTAAYRRKVKSPVEFAVGIVAALEGTVSTTELAKDLARLGQRLFHPPTASGWVGGRYWIDAATLVTRSNLAADLLSGAGRYGDRLDPAAVASRHGHPAKDAATEFLVDLFLQGDVAPGVATDLREPLPLRGLTHAIVTRPEFQLA